MRNSSHPTKQTADSEAHRQSLPIWGDLEGYYHPDHLGSSSWITDQSGEAIQHLQYLPFGEQYVDQRRTGWDAMFTFSGKERDQETGYGYFGARYYDSDLSIWLSVDPLADKYPHQSNYVYCSNNPIRLVDPNGMDEYEFDQAGKLINTIKNEKIASFHVIDKDGNRMASTGDFDAKDVTHRKPTAPGEKMDIFEIKGDANATKTFELMANHTSTEWTHAKIGAEGSEKNIVGTSHSTESTVLGGYLRKTGYTLREVNHNHPSGNPMPSGQRSYDETGERTMDLFGADLYMKKNPNVKLNIYTSKYGYSPYNNNGTLDSRISKQDGKYTIKP